MAKFVKQTITEKGRGDCLRACVASLTGDAIDNIPNFVELPDWYSAFEFHMQTRGYAVVIDDCVECYPFGCFYLVWGNSPRGISHSVIYWNGELAHDPHPDGGGVEPKQIVYFVESFNRQN